MGHRVALMKDGVLQQVDAPTTLYNHPRNMFVAAFIGSPSMNLFWADVASVDADGAVLHLGDATLRLPPGLAAKIPALAGYRGRSLVLGIRPEDIYDAATASELAGDARISGKVELVEALGSDVIVHFGIKARAAIVVSSDSLDELRDVSGGGAAHCTARLSARAQLAIGDTAEMMLDLERLHLFDGETGIALR